jgi:hypothetical protein
LLLKKSPVENMVANYLALVYNSNTCLMPC